MRATRRLAERQLSDGIPASGGDEIRYDCPFCEISGKTSDIHRHLYVHSCGGSCRRCSSKSRAGMYFCQRCGVRGRLEGYGEDIIVPRFRSVTDEYEEAMAVLRGDRVPRESSGLPAGFVPVSRYMLAWDYLIGRGLTSGDIRFYGIGIGTDGSSCGRVVIPSYNDEGDVIFWTGRSYGDSETRYINPVGEVRRRSVFNLLRAAKRGRIIVTEGVFSSMVAGRDAVCTFGKMVSDEQVSLIADAFVRERCEEVVVSLDGDAVFENVQLARRLYSRRCKVRIVFLPYGEDPADLGRNGFRKLVSEAEVFSPSREVGYLLRSA